MCPDSSPSDVSLVFWISSISIWMTSTPFPSRESQGKAVRASKKQVMMPHVRINPTWEHAWKMEFGVIRKENLNMELENSKSSGKFFLSTEICHEIGGALHTKAEEEDS